MKIKAIFNLTSDTEKSDNPKEKPAYEEPDTINPPGETPPDPPRREPPPSREEPPYSDIKEPPRDKPGKKYIVVNKFR